MSKKISDLTSATTPLAGTELVEIVQGGVSKKVEASNLTASGTGRELLTSARTYYVRTDGSDSNNGLENTSGGAFLTIQKAIDVASALDNGGYDVTIRIGAGTFTAANTFKSFIGSGRIVIRGDADNMTSTIISTTSASCFSAFSGFYGTYHLEYLKLQTATSGYCILAIGGGVVTYKNIEFGACALVHVSAGALSMVQATGNYTINGSAVSHLGCYDSGALRVQSLTITISGTPTFSGSFIDVSRCGGALTNGITFSGSATGIRYNASLNGVLYTGGGGANYLPGNSDGTTSTGGQYA